MLNVSPPSAGAHRALVKAQLITTPPNLESKDNTLDCGA